MIKSVIHSSFPKNDNKLLLKKALDKFERGKIDQGKLDKVVEDTRLDIITSQYAAGVDVVTDGMLSWEDEAGHILFNLSGVERGDMLRYFNTNTLYRKPIVKSLVPEGPMFEASMFEREVNLIKNSMTALNQRKFCITGPFSLAKMSQNNTGKSEYEYMLGLAATVARQAGFLIEEFGYLQINEPALVFNVDDADLFCKLYEQFYQYLRLNFTILSLHDGVILSIHYGDIPEKVLDWAMSSTRFMGYLGVDFVEGPNNFDRLKKRSQYKWAIQAGVIDAKSPKLENVIERSEFIRRIFEEIHSYKKLDFLVTTGCGLEFLPWDKAKLKLKMTAAVVQDCRERLTDYG